MISTLVAFLGTAFSLAELGDGFGMYFDMYLLAEGWGEKSVVISGIARGVVDLSLKGVVGDVIDKTRFDRRLFLGAASVTIGLSSLMVFFVNGAEFGDKALVYAVRSLESVALAFTGPCFAAITLSAFGPEEFDDMNVQREMVSHAGSILSAVLSGGVAWVWYPDIELVFLLPLFFSIGAVFFVRHIPRGDHLMGRGFHMRTEKRDAQGCVVNTHEDEPEPDASSYWEVFCDRRIVAITAADFFHVIADANVGLIFNATLAGVGNFDRSGGDDDANDDDNSDDALMSRSAIPLLATAGSAAQIVMIAGTWLVGYLTARGWGRKPFYVAHLCAHPIRVILILICMWTNASSGWLVATELVGGLTGALGIVNAFMRADILFGSGRFNVVDGFQATIRGIAATSSSYILAGTLENQGANTALIISLCISIIPPIIGACFVPETLGMRETDFKEEKEKERLKKEPCVGNKKVDAESPGAGTYIEMSSSSDETGTNNGAEPPGALPYIEMSLSSGTSVNGGVLI